MKTRHELREIVFKILFQIDNTDLNIDDILEFEEENIKNNAYIVTTLAEILE